MHLILNPCDINANERSTDYHQLEESRAARQADCLRKDDQAIRHARQQGVLELLLPVRQGGRAAATEEQALSAKTTSQ